MWCRTVWIAASTIPETGRQDSDDRAGDSFSPKEYLHVSEFSRVMGRVATGRRKRGNSIEAMKNDCTGAKEIITMRIIISIPAGVA